MKELLSKSSSFNEASQIYLIYSLNDTNCTIASKLSKNQKKVRDRLWILYCIWSTGCDNEFQKWWSRVRTLVYAIFFARRRRLETRFRLLFFFTFCTKNHTKMYLFSENFDIPVPNFFLLIRIEKSNE